MTEGVRHLGGVARTGSPSRELTPVPREFAGGRSGKSILQESRARRSESALIENILSEENIIDWTDAPTETLYNKFHYLAEQSAAGSDTAGRGQIWVRDHAPNTLMFTDDLGTDKHILVTQPGTAKSVAFTASSTVDTTYYITASADYTSTLPTSSITDGLVLTFIAVAITNRSEVAIDPGTKAINGSTTDILLFTDFDAISIKWDATVDGWLLIEDNRRLHKSNVSRDVAQSISTATVTFCEHDTLNYQVGGVGSISTFAITAVSTGSNTITIAGDRTNDFRAGERFRVIGSTGNDGVYVVITAVFGSATVLTVASVTNATADGTVSIQGYRVRRDGYLDVSTFWALSNVMDDREAVTIYIYHNNVNIMVKDQQVSTGGSNVSASVFATTHIAVSRHDLVELFLFHIEGASQNTSTYGFYKPRLEAVEVLGR
jgi:hypothetical protein